jgi:hypothetical protein
MAAVQAWTRTARRPTRPSPSSLTTPSHPLFGPLTSPLPPKGHLGGVHRRRDMADEGVAADASRVDDRIDGREDIVLRRQVAEPSGAGEGHDHIVGAQEMPPSLQDIGDGAEIGVLAEPRPLLRAPVSATDNAHAAFTRALRCLISCPSNGAGGDGRY